MLLQNDVDLRSSNDNSAIQGCFGIATSCPSRLSPIASLLGQRMRCLLCTHFNFNPIYFSRMLLQMTPEVALYFVLT